MTINLELSKDGVQKAIKDLQNYASTLEIKMQRLANDLCEIGVTVVNLHYAKGYTEGNGNYTVTVIPTEKGCRLQAMGQDVCFLEFGCGTMTDMYQTAHEGEGQQGLPPIYPGSWSESHSREFTTYGYWYYGGQRYEGIEPKMGMYYASKEMQSQAVEIARRVFND